MAFLSALGFMTAISPVTIRNYMIYNQFIPISAHGGYVFYLGNNPRAVYRYDVTSFGDASTEGEFPAAWNEANRRTGRSLTPNEVSSYWFYEGIKYIQSHPSRFVANLKDKAMAFFNDYEIPDNYNYYFTRDMLWAFRPFIVSFGFALPFAILGIFRLTRERSLLLLVMPLASLLTVLVFYYNARFRITSFPFIFILAATGADYLLSLISEKRHKQAFISTAAALPFLFLAFSPPKIRDDYYFSYIKLGDSIQNVNPSKAIDMLQKAVALHPERAEAHISLGELYFASGRYPDARREFLTAPENPAALVSCSKVEMAMGRTKEAKDCLEKAIRLSPNMLSAYKKLSILYNMTGQPEKAKELLQSINGEGYFKSNYNITR
jgi:tetratricopeptide (TPR) repeat protein